LTISEPATLVTDYLMALVAVAFAVILGRPAVPPAHARWWRLAFGSLAASALLGGSWHGFHESMAVWLADLCWRATLATASLSSFAVMRATAHQWLGQRHARALALVALLKLAAALVLELLRPAFAVVVWDLGATLAFAVAAAAPARKRAPRAFGLLASGVGLFLAGAVIQQAGLGLHPAFNHNDLFHVVQILGNTCFFLSARARPARSAPRTFSTSS
jgi:hypothetical protein